MNIHDIPEGTIPRWQRIEVCIMFVESMWRMVDSPIIGADGGSSLETLVQSFRKDNLGDLLSSLTIYFASTHFYRRNHVEGGESSSWQPEAESVLLSAYIRKHFRIALVNARKGCICMQFAISVRIVFSRCSTTRASEQILGWAVMGQKKPAIQPYI